MPVNIHNPNETELSMNDVYSLAWNATHGSKRALREIKEYHDKYVRLANSRMRQLEKNNLELSAYNRARSYLDSRNQKWFSTAMPQTYKDLKLEMAELLSFLNAKTSRVKYARVALNAKLDKISEYTKTEYTPEQRSHLGRLLGDDSISTLLRDVRGDSDEVLDFLEEVAKEEEDNVNIKEIKSIIDRYLQGYNPFQSDPFFSNFGALNYDEMMDELAKVTNWERKQPGRKEPD